MYIHVNRYNNKILLYIIIYKEDLYLIINKILKKIINIHFFTLFITVNYLYIQHPVSIKQSLNNVV